MVAGLAKAAGAAKAKAKRVADRVSDQMYNARRRMRRAAERYEAKAKGLEGIEKSRYEALATDLRTQIQKTYVTDKTKTGADKYSVSPDRVEEFSMDYLSGEQFKSISKKLLRGKVGRRIYASTVQLWRDTDGDIDSTIMKELGVDSMDDVIAYFEDELGDELYADLESTTFSSSSDTAVLNGQLAVSRIVNANNDDE